MPGTGKTATPAHSVETMPIWGEVLRNDINERTTLTGSQSVRSSQSIASGPVVSLRDEHRSTRETAGTQVGA